MLNVFAPSPPVPGGVDEVVARRADPQHVLAHRLGAARDLVGRLALQPQRDEEAADLGRRRLARHDRVHHAARLLAREVAAVEQLRQRRLDHARLQEVLARARARAASAPTRDGTARRRPRSSRWRTAITSPSAAVADTSSAVRDRRRGERVVAAGREVLRQAGEDAAAVVVRRRSPCRARARAPRRPRRRTPSTIAWWPRQTPSTGTRPANARTIASETPASSGRPGPGRDDEVRRREPLRLVDRDLVVSPHHDLRSELAEQVRQVVRERVVVVDQQHFASSAGLRQVDRAPRARRSLRRHSSCSAAGSQSATIPPPACSSATPSCSDDRADRDARVERRRPAARSRRRPRRARAGSPRARR